MIGWVAGKPNQEMLTRIPFDPWYEFRPHISTYDNLYGQLEVAQRDRDKALSTAQDRNTICKAWKPANDELKASKLEVCPERSTSNRYKEISSTDMTIFLTIFHRIVPCTAL